LNLPLRVFLCKAKSLEIESVSRGGVVTLQWLLFVWLFQPRKMPIYVFQVHCVSDPCTLDINGVIIGLTSTDILFHLGAEEISGLVTSLRRSFAVLCRLSFYHFTYRGCYLFLSLSFSLSLGTTKQTWKCVDVGFVDFFCCTMSVNWSQKHVYVFQGIQSFPIHRSNDGMMCVTQLEERGA